MPATSAATKNLEDPTELLFKFDIMAPKRSRGENDEEDDRAPKRVQPMRAARENTSALRTIEKTINRKLQVTKGEEVVSAILTLEFRYGFISLNVSPCKCCKFLEVDISLQMDDEKRSKDAGGMIACLLDKSIHSGKDEASWLQEQPEEKRKPGSSECHTIMRELFVLTDKGKIEIQERVAEEAHTPLAAEKIVFLDTFRLESEYRGTGLALKALLKFHKFLKGELGASTVVLRPARILKSPWRDRDGRDLDDLEIEEKLIKVYEEGNYTTWLRRNPEVDDPRFTVMGIDLRLDEERNEEAAQSDATNGEAAELHDNKDFEGHGPLEDTKHSDGKSTLKRRKSSGDVVVQRDTVDDSYRRTVSELWDSQEDSEGEITIPVPRGHTNDTGHPMIVPELGDSEEDSDGEIIIPTPLRRTRG